MLPNSRLKQIDFLNLSSSLWIVVNCQASIKLHTPKVKFETKTWKVVICRVSEASFTQTKSRYLGDTDKDIYMPRKNV